MTHVNADLKAALVSSVVILICVHPGAPFSDPERVSRLGDIVGPLSVSASVLQVPCELGSRSRQVF